MQTTLKSSALPPLDPERPQLAQALSDPEISIPESKSNVFHFYPRIHQLEEETDAVQQRVPVAITKTMFNLTQAIMTLQDRLMGQNAPPVNLSEIERKISADMELETQKVRTAINRKLEHLRATVEQPKSVQTKVLDSQIANLQDWIHRESRRKEQKLAKLERDLAKLAEIYPISRRAQSVERIADGLAEQNTVINRLIQELTDIENSLPIVLAPPKRPDDEDDCIERRRIRRPVPDLEEPLRGLHERMATFRADFSHRLADAQEKADETSEKVLSLQSIICEVSGGVQSIESRVIELNHLCKSLSQQLQDMTRQSGKSRDCKLLDYLTVQVQTAQDSISSDLNSIQHQLTRYSNTLPLIVT